MASRFAAASVNFLHHTKIIVVSGRDYGVDRTSAIEAGADEYLVKPIRWENLREVIDRVLPPSSDGEGHPARSLNSSALNPVEILGRPRLDSGAGLIDRRLRRQHQLHRSPGRGRNHHPRRRLGDAGTGHRAGRRVRRQPIRPDAASFPTLIGTISRDCLSSFPPIRVKISFASSVTRECTPVSRPFWPDKWRNHSFPSALRECRARSRSSELKEMEFSIGKVKVQAGTCESSRDLHGLSPDDDVTDRSPTSLITNPMRCSNSVRPVRRRPASRSARLRRRCPAASWSNSCVGPTF